MSFASSYIHVNQNLLQLPVSKPPKISTYKIEGLHDVVRTYTHTILPAAWFPFCMARYREKQKTLEPLIYFTEWFEISTKCVC